MRFCFIRDSVFSQTLTSPTVVGTGNAALSSFHWFCPPIAITYPLHVVARLSIRRHLSAILQHRAFARVVARQDQIDPSVKLPDELLQITRAPRDILCRIRCLLTPNRAAVPGINCINPRAPFGDKARGLK